MFEIKRITDDNPTYCSLVPQTQHEKAILYNATQNPSHKLSEFINQRITFTNVFMEQVEIQDEESGEIRKGVRTILFTPEGEGITATSNGVARSMYGIFSIFGTPDTWEDGVSVIVRQTETAKGRTFKLEVIPE